MNYIQPPAIGITVPFGGGWAAVAGTVLFFGYVIYVIFAIVRPAQEEHRTFDVRREIIGGAILFAVVCILMWLGPSSTTSSHGSTRLAIYLVFVWVLFVIFEYFSFRSLNRKAQEARDRRRGGSPA